MLKVSIGKNIKWSTTFFFFEKNLTLRIYKNINSCNSQIPSKLKKDRLCISASREFTHSAPGVIDGPQPTPSLLLAMSKYSLLL